MARPNFAILTSLLVVWGALGAASAQPPGEALAFRAPAATPQPKAESLSPPARDAGGLVQHLDHVSWRVREDATNRLIEIGPPCYDALRAALRPDTSVEQRRRIRYVAREIYLNETMGPRGAFLGISHRAGLRGAGQLAHPWEAAILVTGIIRETAADRAGLAEGDLIIALNGRSAGPTYSAQEMVGWIAQQTPNTACTLGVLRGARFSRYDLGSRELSQQAFQDAKFEVVAHGHDARIPEGGTAIRVTDVGARPNELGLAPGTLIIALDDKPIPTEQTLSGLERWIASLPAEPPGEHEPLPRDRRGGGARRGDNDQRIQLLNAGEFFETDVLLGRRPYSMAAPVIRADQGGRDALELAMEEFELWWVSEFEPQETGPGGPGDPWRLHPPHRDR